jgi:hypothetical protein
MNNLTTVLLALIAIIPSTLAAVLAYLASQRSAEALKQGKETHLLVNSRMTELLAITKTSAKAEGVLEEKSKKVE